MMETVNGHFANSEPMRDSSAPSAMSLQSFIVRRRQIVRRARSGAVAITDGKK
jgi:hypothetical protein